MKSMWISGCVPRSSVVFFIIVNKKEKISAPQNGLEAAFCNLYLLLLLQKRETDTVASIVNMSQDFEKNIKVQEPTACYDTETDQESICSSSKALSYYQKKTWVCQTSNIPTRLVRSVLPKGLEVLSQCSCSPSLLYMPCNFHPSSIHPCAVIGQLI